MTKNETSAQESARLAREHGQRMNEQCPKCGSHVQWDPKHERYGMAEAKDKTVIGCGFFGPNHDGDTLDELFKDHLKQINDDFLEGQGKEFRRLLMEDAMTDAEQRAKDDLPAWATHVELKDIGNDRVLIAGLGTTNMLWTKEGIEAITLDELIELLSKTV